MGVSCQILLYQPTNGYYLPQSSVKGMLKYAIDEDTEFQEIVIELKAKGQVRWTEHHHRNKHRTVRHYLGTEKYFEMQKFILNKTINLKIGAYEHEFEFILPDDDVHILPNNIPSTFKDHHCSIVYSVKVKFKRPGLLKFDKKFSKEITVKGEVRPIVQQLPIINEVNKSLFKPFSSSTNNINLKSRLEKDLLTPGESVRINFSIVNDSDVIVPKIKAELYETRIYTANCGRVKKYYKTIKSDKGYTAAVPSQGKADLSTSVPIDNDLYSEQNSRIFTRKYKLLVTLHLPFPHTNASMKIPVAIGRGALSGRLQGECSQDTSGQYGATEGTSSGSVPADNPPSYWEAMGEEKEGDDFKNNLEDLSLTEK